MPAKVINISDTIVMNDHPNHHNITGWDFDPQNPDVSSIILSVKAASGPGTNIYENDLVVFNDHPNLIYKVSSWVYDSMDPDTDSITLIVELQD